MAVFGCAGCGAVLTAAVSEVALPIHLADTHWEQLHPPLLESGSYAVDPAPFGPQWRQWRQWHEAGEGEAAERGRFAPFGALSDGPSGTILLTPGDMRGTKLILERSGGYCMGIDGRDGPNLACLACDLPVGTRMDDCGCWQVVRLVPQAVVRLPGPPERQVMDWAELLATGALSHRLSEYRDISAGVALAHVVVGSGGAPVEVARGRSPSSSVGRSARCYLPGKVRSGSTWQARGSASRPPTCCWSQFIRRPGTRGSQVPGRCRCLWMPRSGPSWPSRHTGPGCRSSAGCRQAWSGTIRCRCTRCARSGRPGRRSGTRSRGCRPSGNRGCGRSTTEHDDPSEAVRIQS